ncbi:ATP-binding protein [Cellulomonas cellasea]|uniref:Histidine kinase n=2 Tax=Cellulomonas cellasea TaxID=43670 RepID=A0A0A0B553_9CELL|nr:ATP-binding protein [Cellulomonas cellasea]KGM01950.1 histidine kinase [Cellulomonas cellasea DSM 20118]GEA86117.1 hypothetical protein CCE01nite_00660 [Cellulomonas cellasea]
MTTHSLDEHVLLHDVPSGRAQWTHEQIGPAGLLVVAKELRMPAHRGAVWVARHWTSDRAEDWGISSEIQAVLALLTSELVGNAIVHALGGEIEVRMSLALTGLTVAVSDSSQDSPQIRDPDPQTPGGLGLPLVDMMSASWGHHPRPARPGKTVWFRLVV